MKCGKLLNEEDGITCVSGEWVCDRDTCRTLDGDNQAHIIPYDMYKLQPDRDITIKGGWTLISKPSEVQDGGCKIMTLPTYDITAYGRNGEVVGQSKGCLGNKALEFWWEYHLKRLRKLVILTEDLEMAEHNARCYAKPGYEEECAEETARIEILGEWIKKIRNNEI
jgi:hypothetical protein